MEVKLDKCIGLKHFIPIAIVCNCPWGIYQDLFFMAKFCFFSHRNIDDLTGKKHGANIEIKGKLM